MNSEPAPSATVGGSTYRWLENWATLSDEPGPGQAHTAMARTRDGYLVFAHSTCPQLIVAQPSGQIAQRVAFDGAGEFHGITVVERGGAELLWVADTGRRSFAGPTLRVEQQPLGGRVILVDLRGQLLNQLPRPGHPAYAHARYVPTSVEVDETRYGGSGDIWVADGYGAGIVHRFRADGTYMASLTGKDGAGQFRQPHGLAIDRRRDVAELYVADRQNQRIQVFGLDGTFRRVVGAGVLVAPSCMAFSGDSLFVTDLLARRVTVFDAEDRVLGHLFAHSTPLAWGSPQVSDGWPDAWPNARSSAGEIVRPPLRPGEFNSPHGVAADSTGNLYVAEFLLGGRTVKLEVN